MKAVAFSPDGKILASGTASELANNPKAREIYLGELEQILRRFGVKYSLAGMNHRAPRLAKHARGRLDARPERWIEHDGRACQHLRQIVERDRIEVVVGEGDEAKTKSPQLHDFLDRRLRAGQDRPDQRARRPGLHLSQPDAAQ